MTKSPSPHGSAAPERREHDHATILAFRGSIAQSTRDVLFDTVRGCRDGGTVIVDLADVAYLDSLGIGFLVTAHNMARNEGRRFVLCGLQPELREIFEVTRLDQLFTIRDSAGTAVKEFAPPDANPP